MVDECMWVWSIGGVIMAEKNQSSNRETLVPVTFNPPQVPNGLPWNQIQAWQLEAGD
jgi:hypothetical protein